MVSHEGPSSVEFWLHISLICFFRLVAIIKPSDCWSTNITSIRRIPHCHFSIGLISMENIDSWSSQMQNGRPTSNHHQGGPALQQELEILSQCSKRNKLSNSYSSYSCSSSMCPTPQETRTCLSPPTTILGFCCFLTTKCGLTIGSGSGHICNLMTCRLFQVPHCYLVVLITNGEVS
jgi:hypothetical protein